MTTKKIVKCDHDIILDWIYSCTTFDQLLNLIPYIKSRPFDYSNLLFMVRLKTYQIQADSIVNNLLKIAAPYIK